MKPYPLTSLLPFLAFLFSDCNNSKSPDKTQPGIATLAEPRLTATLGGIDYAEERNQIPIIHTAATVHNSTSSTLRFQSFSCSWESYFLTSSDSFEIFRRPDCYLNVPYEIIIPPGKKQDFYLRMKAKFNSTTLLDDTLRIGMLLTSMANQKTLEQHLKDSSGTFLWSNSIDLSRLNGKQY